MIDLHFGIYAFICPMVFLAGFVDSIAGGGGLITQPSYLLTGLSPAFAGGTNKFSAMAGTLVSSFQYIKNKQVSWKAGLFSLLGAIPGSMLGARLLTILPQNAVKIGILVALPLVAMMVMRKKDFLNPQAKVKAEALPGVSLLIGLVVGSYDGLIGPGTGTFLMILYVSVLGLDPLSASGTARLVNLGSNLGALVSLALAGRVLYLLAIPAALFGMAGNYLGSKLALKRGAPFIRKLLVMVMGLLLIALLVDVIRQGL